MSDANLNALSTRGMPVVGYASSHKHNADRWTTLTIWYRTDARRPILVEVFGGTKIAGEHNRKRRRCYATIEEALAFVEPGPLADKLRKGARSWWKMNGNDRSLMPAATDPRKDNGNDR